MAGRFTQPDPIGLAGGLNVYGFAGGDPANFVDPFGLDTTYYDIYGVEVERIEAKQDVDTYFLRHEGKEYRLDYGLEGGPEPFQLVHDPEAFDPLARALGMSVEVPVMRFYLESHPGGKLDLKEGLPERMLWNAGGGLYVHRDKVGNAAWGYYGKTHGYPLWLLLWGARVQGKSTLAGREDPLDQVFVARGYRLP
jgi:uncharacterized protein RhaS with RHS repeats